MYIQQAFRAKHEWWRYLIGVISAFLISQLGAIPWFILVAVKLVMDGESLQQMTDTDVLMNTLSSNTTFFLMLLGFAIGMLALYLIVKHLHKQSFRELTTSRKKIDMGRVLFGFMLIAIYSIVTTLIDYYISPEDYVLQFQLIPFIILAIISLVMIPLQTSFEEYLFRGYLMQGIGVLAKNRWVPLFTTSLIFGGLHIANPEVSEMGYIIMVYYIGTGLFLGIMTLMDEGMELALGFHAGNNLVGALLVTTDWTAFQTNSILKGVGDPAVGADIVLPIIIIYPIFLFVMAKRYKWNNWREKLFGKVEEPITPNTEPYFEEFL